MTRQLSKSWDFRQKLSLWLPSQYTIFTPSTMIGNIFWCPRWEGFVPRWQRRAAGGERPQERWGGHPAGRGQPGAGRQRLWAPRHARLELAQQIFRGFVAKNNHFRSVFLKKSVKLLVQIYYNWQKLCERNTTQTISSVMLGTFFLGGGIVSWAISNAVLNL